MRRIDFDLKTLTDPQRQWWEKWSEKAQKARQDIIDAAKDKHKPNANDFKDEIWKELKNWLLKHVFHDKCAYCEIKNSRASAHAEHYRPKGLVTLDDKGKQVTVKCQDGNEHPGYYWLAYDWQNIIPACEKCNTSKANQFEIEASNHICSPDAGPDTETLNDLEHPFLLHPYFGDLPEDHLMFDRNGMVHGKSEKGRWTIRVCKLDDHDLVVARNENQKNTLMNYTHEICGNRNNPVSTTPTKSAEIKDRFFSKKVQFSLAVNDYCSIKHYDTHGTESNLFDVKRSIEDIKWVITQEKIRVKDPVDLLKES